MFADNLSVFTRFNTAVPDCEVGQNMHRRRIIADATRGNPNDKVRAKTL